MELSALRTITVHDVDMATLYDLVVASLFS
jgi:hypothetical protein